jgi:3alpha(or 20beta)-hydroxysteroid dehydrogenase
MAEALARAGAAVVIGDIREELGQATVDAIKKSGGDAAFQPLDVTDDHSWARCIEGTIAELGGLDIVVNNAGVEITQLVADLNPDDIRKMLEVNILGTSLGIKHAFRAMRPGGSAGRGGAVVGLTPQGRLGEVADMADAVVFLASDASRFITGAGLPVDGGMGM